MESLSDVDRGARIILRDCLKLERGQEVVILVDETTLSLVPALTHAAAQLAIPSTILYVPLSQQKATQKLEDLPTPLGAALKDARAILTCITGDTSCTTFRGVIINNFLGSHSRIGHMPGASEAVLQAANVDLTALTQACRLVALPLARGEALELITFDDHGRDYHLHALSGGWKRLPIASTGIIFDGAWGNVPSGETYIAPLEESAHGSVFINGALPGLVIPPEEGIELVFTEGKLALPESPAGATFAHLLSEARPSLEAGDPFWTWLAEIGIGANPSIRQLTGNMLLDEKMGGTAHIATGKNNNMGGTIESHIHIDMVTVSPTLLVNGKLVMERGKLVLQQEDWEENHLHLPPGYALPSADACVARTATEVQIKKGKLYRVGRSDSGHWSSYRVGAEATARLARHFYQKLPPRQMLSMRQVAAELHLDLHEACCLAAVMSAYGVVSCHPPQPGLF